MILAAFEGLRHGSRVSSLDTCTGQGEDGRCISVTLNVGNKLGLAQSHIISA